MVSKHTGLDDTLAFQANERVKGGVYHESKGREALVQILDNGKVSGLAMVGGGVDGRKGWGRCYFYDLGGALSLRARLRWFLVLFEASVGWVEPLEFSEARTAV